MLAHIPLQYALGDLEQDIEQAEVFNEKDWFVKQLARRR